nr:hypothetical protein [Hymenobacter oligotrophus]
MSKRRGGGHRWRGMDRGAVEPADGFDKTLEANWLEQVVGHPKIEGAEGVVGVGRAQDDCRRLGQRAQQLQASEAGHVHVQKQHVHRRGAQKREGLHGAVPAAGPHGQTRQAVQISAQHGVSQWFVIDQQTA